MGQEHEVKVLIVCSGNICRSPMIHWLLQREVRLRGLENVHVDSAGTLGIEGRPAADEAIRALAEIGENLSGHRSRGIVAADLQDHDVVVGMTSGHLQELQSLVPQNPRDRRFLILAFERSAEPAADAPDLEDPIGCPLELYRTQRDRLLPCVRNLAAYLVQLDR